MVRDQILIIDDEPNILEVLKALLEKENYEVFTFQSFDEALPVLNQENISLVITDLAMPQKSGFDVLEYCKKYSPDLPVMMITAFGTIEQAVQAMKQGAFDFIAKPFDREALKVTTRKAIESRVRIKRDPELNMLTAEGLGPIAVVLMGDEPSTQHLRQQVLTISKNQAHVFIQGEVGAGQRMLAYEIHRKSSRISQPFISIHADAIPQAFQMAELFGVEKGATPLAWTARPGRLELASAGTLFIESATSLSQEVQLALLESFENDFYIRVGGVKKFLFDVRLILSYSQGELVPEFAKMFSPEILQVLPLRKRKDDLAQFLFPYFLEKACHRQGIEKMKIPSEVTDWLKLQTWSGNLGQLEQWTQQLVQNSITRARPQSSQTQSSTLQLPTIQLSQLVRPD